MSFQTSEHDIASLAESGGVVYFTVWGFEPRKPTLLVGFDPTGYAQHTIKIDRDLTRDLDDAMNDEDAYRHLSIALAKAADLIIYVRQTAKLQRLGLVG